MRIRYFVQTPFISHNDQNLIYVGVEDWDRCNSFDVQLTVEGKTVYSQRIFAPDFSFLMPCYEINKNSILRITPFEDTPVEAEFEITPPKHWRIPLLYSSHEDLGYCAYIDKLHYECYEYLKRAMELCFERKDFRYMIEHVWWLDAFDFYATEEEKARLKQLLKEKRIELNAIHSGVHTSWADSEQLVREMYFGCLEAKEAYNVEARCAIYTDISGVSQSVVNAYPQMGIKYVGVLSNGFRNSQESLEIPPLFWWEDQTGKNRVLFWYQRSYRPYGLDAIWCDTKRQYTEGEYFFDESKALKTERWFADKIRSVEPYGLDILPISFYDDREYPTTMLLTVCEGMRKKWKYPQFYMDIPSVFLAEIEEKCSEKLPTYRGDITDQWGDFATISPELTSKKRKVSCMLYNAELLSTVSAIKQGALYPGKLFRNTYWSLCEFDEHCWATSSKHPQKMHRYNIEKVKREPIEASYENIKQVLSALCSSHQENQVSIINTVPYTFENRIRTDAKAPIPAHIAHQILPDGTVVTDPIVFKGIEIKSFDSILPQNVSKEIITNCIETSFYKININRETMRITSLIDKETNEELLDRNTRFELGQFIYWYTEQKTDANACYELPVKNELKIYDGDVAYVIVQKSAEEQSGAEITAQFTFYKKNKTIDIDLSYRNAKGLIGDYYDRYKKNYFFAFPFKIDRPTFYTELQSGEKNENTDLIPLNSNDFTVTQNWLVAENEKYGIALYSEDMSVFHLGNIKYNRFSPAFEENKAHFYLYASSNRCNNLFYSSVEQCKANFHLSMLPFKGNHRDVVPNWSNQLLHQPVICGGSVENETLISVDSDNLKLTAFKRAENCEDAVILRFTETKGKSAECRLSLFFAPTKAVYASTVERDGKALQCEGNTVTFRSDPYSYTTLKIYGSFKIKDKDSL